jgi:hypothetical protein
MFVFITAHSALGLAHTPGLSSGVYFAEQKSLDAKLSFSRRELLGICKGLDADHDLELTQAELTNTPDCLDLGHLLRVTADDAPCTSTPYDSTLTESDGVIMRAFYTCPARPDHFTVTLGFLHELPVDHRHVVRAEGNAPFDRSFGAKDTSFTLSPPAERAATMEAGAAPAAPAAHAPPSFFLMGVFHILRGFDHLIFVFGLLLARGGLSRATARPLFFAVTAFSVGHSISLALAVTGVATPGARWVEPLIAVSIAAIGVENLLLPNARRRWRITLPFGFVHGFGFAEALRAVLTGSVAFPLLTFNLGVEAGQLLALAAMLLLLHGAGRVGILGKGLLRAANVALVAFGLVLAFYRIISP